MSLESIKNKILENPNVRKEYEENKITHQVARKVMKVRLNAGMTQKELAGLIGTEQPGIARIESGYYDPGLKTLDKIAKALRTEFLFTFASLGEFPITHSIVFVAVMKDEAVSKSTKTSNVGVAQT